MLLPSDESGLRARALQWFAEEGLTPRIVGEFDDSALMKSFGATGTGVFPAPAVIGDEVRQHYGVRSLGISTALRYEFYAISVERRITHPAVLAITGAARDLLLWD
jgi:LysR family transcriptional regulator, transcriptional activator of nhaA